MPYLLNLIYLLLIVLASPWLLWQAIRKGKYREGYAQKFLGLVPRRTSGRPCLWLHAVSVGEVNLLAPLLREIQRQRPDWECVVSSTTMTGMALARKKYPHLTAFYCPLDFSWAVAAAVRRVRPDVLVLAELELWPNLIRAARVHGARVAVINGRLGEHSFRGYRRVRPLVARLLRQIDVIAVQDETYAERFRALGPRPETVRVTGSMKYDGAQTDRDNPTTRRLKDLAGFGDGDVIFLAGSTQEPEEEVALEVFRRLSPDWPQLRLILVPRHPDRFEAVAKMLDASGIAWQRRTHLDHQAATGGRADHKAAAGGRAEVTVGAAVELAPQAVRRERPTALTPTLSQRERGQDSPALTPTISQGERGQDSPAITPTLSRGERGQDSPALTPTLSQRERGQDSPALTPTISQGERGQDSPAITPTISRGERGTAPVLLVDVVGELGAWWGTTQIAFVGGSLGNRGGQNMIEPAAYGAAVAFGPNTWNFRDIVAALRADQAAVVVRNGDELHGFVRRCLEEPDYAAALGQRARALVLRQLGATERTLELLAGDASYKGRSLAS